MSIGLKKFVYSDHWGEVDARHKVLVFTNSSEESEQELMMKMMAAIQINPYEDVKVINTSDEGFPSLRKMIKQQPFELVLFFGVHPSQVGWGKSVALFEMTDMYTTKAIVSVSLADLLHVEKGDLYKKRLWSQLKLWSGI